VFTKFYRGRANGAPAGVGLGLYGSRIIVEAHGGRIEAASTPGVETRVRVRLPASPPGRAG
jgi:signal transduction histidine kinase